MAGDPGGPGAWPPARAAAEVRVGTLTAAADRVRRGRVWVVGLPAELMPDLVIVGGARPGPVLAVIAGLHGDEAAGVGAVLELAARAERADLAGTLLLVPVANVAAFREHRPYVNPLDGQDLERVFPGKPRGGPSVRLAHALFEQVAGAADAVLDLHGGGLVERVAPYVLVPAPEATPEAEATHARALALAGSFGTERLVVAPLAGSLVAAAAAAGRPALRAAAGSHGDARPATVRRLAEGVCAVMAALGMSPGTFARPTAPRPGRLRWLASPADGYWRPAVAVPGRVAAGRLLGHVTPRGEPESARVAVRSPVDGELLVLLDRLATRHLAPLAALRTEGGDERR